MTNEAIAEQLQNCYDEKLCMVLWENVKKLLFMKSEKIYFHYKDRFSSLGIELSDIKQECFFVFLKAVEKYHEPYKFVTFLEYPFKTMILKLIKFNENPYTENIDNVKDCNGYSLSETICDPEENIDIFVDSRTDGEIVRAEVEKLALKQKQIIKLFYFHDFTDIQIAKNFGSSSANIGQIRKRALLQLRRSAVLRKLYYTI